MTASNANVTTSTIATVAGSYGQLNDATWSTSNAASLNKDIWLVFSDSATLSTSTQYGLFSSNNAEWVMPASYSNDSKVLLSGDINVNGFGTTSGSGASGKIIMGDTPSALYWDAALAAAGGDGTWSTTTTVWSTTSGGVSGAGQYAWGTTSGSTYYAGAGLTATFGGTNGTVTVSGNVEARNGLNFDPTTGTTYTLTTGTINLAGSAAANNTITVATGDTAIISATLSGGSNGVQKAGAGTLRLDGTNTYSGATTINAGTLQANASNALQSTSGITVNNGGSLLVSANNAVNDSAGLTLNSGTTTAGLVLSGNNRSDVMGTLTLSSNSVIDMGSGTGNVWLSFNNLAAVLSSTTQLNIWNYEFGVDHIYFHGSTTNIGNATSLANVNFYSGAGTGFLGNGFLSGTELHSAVVPEPEVYATALLLLAGLGFHLYRQKRRPLVTA
jgi:autotransporter-associated beta strand protein